jgi:hypothetical protein
MYLSSANFSGPFRPKANSYKTFQTALYITSVLLCFYFDFWGEELHTGNPPLGAQLAQRKIKQFRDIYVNMLTL